MFGLCNGWSEKAPLSGWYAGRFNCIQRDNPGFREYKNRVGLSSAGWFSGGKGVYTSYTHPREENADLWKSTLRLREQARQYTLRYYGEPNISHADVI